MKKIFNLFAIALLSGVTALVAPSKAKAADINFPTTVPTSTPVSISANNGTYQVGVGSNAGNTGGTTIFSGTLGSLEQVVQGIYDVVVASGPVTASTPVSLNSNGGQLNVGVGSTAGSGAGTTVYSGTLGSLYNTFQSIFTTIFSSGNTGGSTGGNTGGSTGGGSTEPHLPINNGLLFLLLSGVAGGILVLRKRNIEAQA